MTKLKLDDIVEDKPVKLTIALPAEVHDDLVAYAAVLSEGQGEPSPEPAKLIIPMITRFMQADREFAKARRAAQARAVSG